MGGQEISLETGVTPVGGECHGGGVAHRRYEEPVDALDGKDDFKLHGVTSEQRLQIEGAHQSAVRGRVGQGGGGFHLARDTVQQHRDILRKSPQVPQSDEQEGLVARLLRYLPREQVFGAFECTRHLDGRVIDAEVEDAALEGLRLDVAGDIQRFREEVEGLFLLLAGYDYGRTADVLIHTPAFGQFLLGIVTGALPLRDKVHNEKLRNEQQYADADNK